MNRTLDRDKSCERIRKICEKRGITVDDISDNLNVSKQTVYGWFSAKKMPTLDHLIELADLLDVSTDDLLVKRDFDTG